MVTPDLASRVLKLERDTYFGDGPNNPSITTRLAVLEEVVDKISSNLSKIVWMLASALVLGAANLVVHSLKHY